MKLDNVFRLLFAEAALPEVLFDAGFVLLTPKPAATPGYDAVVTIATTFPLTSLHGKEPAGSVQRRRARHHHHHHGAGVEGAARDRTRRPETVAAGVLELRV